MDERARQILEQAWANVEAIEKMEVREPTIDSIPVERWTPPVRERRRELDTIPHNPAADKEEFDKQWDAWFVQRFTQLFEQHMAAFSDAVVEITFTRMDKHRKELQAEVAALRQEVALLRAVRDGGNVMELKKA
jgi:hypothetical protein